ncbi:MAG: hypothetical protein ABI744_01865 [Chloroflexota bacterium]
MDKNPDNERDTHDGQIDSDDLRRLGEEGGPVGLRTGRNPANLGDEVPEQSDLTTPELVPSPAEM